MTEAQYLKVCEQACRNIANRLEELELYHEPTLNEYMSFHAEVKKQVRGYQDALEKFLDHQRTTDAAR